MRSAGCCCTSVFAAPLHRPTRCRRPRPAAHRPPFQSVAAAPFPVDRPPASRRTARNADTCAPDTVASVSQQNQTDRCRQTGRSDTDRREWIDEQTAASLQRSEFAAASAASSSPRLVLTGTSERALENDAAAGAHATGFADHASSAAVGSVAAIGRIPSHSHAAGIPASLHCNPAAMRTGALPCIGALRTDAGQCWRPISGVRDDSARSSPLGSLPRRGRDSHSESLPPPSVDLRSIAVRTRIR